MTKKYFKRIVTLLDQVYLFLVKECYFLKEYNLIFASLETWILYSGKEQGVSKAVRDAYSKYGNKEFGTRNVDIHKDNTDRHVKLITITDKEVGISFH